MRNYNNTYWTNLGVKPKNIKMCDKINRIYSYTISVYGHQHKFLEYITIESSFTFNNSDESFKNFMKNNYNLDKQDYLYRTTSFKRDGIILDCIYNIEIVNMNKYKQGKRLLKLKTILND